MPMARNLRSPHGRTRDQAGAAARGRWRLARRAGGVQRRRAVRRVAGAVGRAQHDGQHDDAHDAPTPTETATPTPTKSAAPNPQVAGEVITGLAVPWGIAFLPDGTALVGERDTGRLLRVSGGSADPVGTLDVRSRVDEGGETGLLGLALHPAFGTNRLLVRLLLDRRRQPHRPDDLRRQARRARADPDRHRDVDPPQRRRPGVRPGRLLYASTGDAEPGQRPGHRLGRRQSAPDDRRGQRPRRQPVRQPDLELRPPQRRRASASTTPAGCGSRSSATRAPTSST